VTDGRAKAFIQVNSVREVRAPARTPLGRYSSATPGLGGGHNWRIRLTSYADDFLRERAGTAKPKDMLKYLRRAPKVAPNADDMP
jgi:hypothetical protein